MEFTKSCRKKLTASIIFAVCGVVCFMIPYIAVAHMVVKLLTGKKKFRIIYSGAPLKRQDSC
jgi:hypothetical protein